MEVKNREKFANEFWPVFSKKITFVVILAQLFLTSTLIYIVLKYTDLSYNSLDFWIIISTVLIINAISYSIVCVLAMSPFKKIMGAVLHISGERTTISPPNPNSKNNEKTGLKDAIQTIYSLSANNHESSAKNTPNSPIVEESLSNTNCGFVVLNEKREIIYSNLAAPIKINSNGVSSLGLYFNGSDTIEKWLDSCEQNTIKSEKSWTRIPDKLPNEENRRFFDVIASYQKGKAASTILVMLDKTSLYSIDEENLDFISFAAHELRGPITVIRGYLDVLNDELNDKFEGDQKELFRRLIVSSNRLSNYIDNILNTSRYDRRHLKLHLVEDTLSSIYDTINDDMSLRAGAQNRLLSVSIPADLPTIAVDKASMSEVLGNLIDNAIKYSNEGGLINVSAKTNGDYIQIDIEDHGIGMPANVVSNLFQKFYRSHRSRETVSGTGIGLYISKAIVESHGGSISVRSEEGKGSIFTILLPTYSTIADKLQTNHNINESLISEGNGWIRNHSMYRS